ncbi:MAG: rhodanese-like domain-containing protein [Oscillospiraceae bacterium]|nr:rhodanese-like domain-containing protein [Oscillospiraceae bacterium]
MYEEGQLTAGDPCIDDLAAIGKQKAEEYYQLAEENGYEVPAPGWQSITQEEAKKMMAEDDGYVIVDVRRQDEYDAGHIHGAVLIPNESIGTEPPEALPDSDQIILIYCRSGNRSKQAAQKLADMGYTKVYEFGGINTWDGGIEMKASAPAADRTENEAFADGTSNCA